MSLSIETLPKIPTKLCLSVNGPARHAEVMDPCVHMLFWHLFAKLRLGFRESFGLCMCFPKNPAYNSRLMARLQMRGQSFFMLL